MDERELAENMQKLLVLMSRLDQRIAPMLDADGEYFNQRYILFQWRISDSDSFLPNVVCTKVKKNVFIQSRQVMC